MGPGGCNDCLAPAYGYVAVRCAAVAGIQRNLVNARFGPKAAARHRRLRSEPVYLFMANDERVFA